MPDKPDKWTDSACPTCGTPRRIVNPAWLRARREAFGLSLRDVGAVLELSAVYLSDIERGRRACPVRVREMYERLDLCLRNR